MSSDDLTSFLIGSGAGSFIGFISGILFALQAPNPREKPIEFESVEKLIEMFLEDVRKVEEILYGEAEEDKG